MTEKLKPVIEYYDDGTIKYAYSVDENGNKQGPYETYHENGQLWEKCTCKNGKYDGPYESYHENGQLWEKCTYKDGEYDGLYEEYRRNGQLEKIKVYKKGVPLYGEEAEEYLEKNYPIKYKELQAIKLKEARKNARKEQEEKEAREKTARKGLNARLAQMDEQMPPTQLRQSAKRAEVAKFRKNHPDKHAGRVIEKKNWLQKLFRGGR